MHLKSGLFLPEGEAFVAGPYLAKGEEHQGIGACLDVVGLGVAQIGHEG